MDDSLKTPVINNIYGVVRQNDYVELDMDRGPSDPIRLKVEDSKKLGAIYNLKGDIRKDSHLPEGTVDEVVVDVSKIDDDTVSIEFPNLTRDDYDGSKYELDRGVNVKASTLEEEMLG